MPNSAVRLLWKFNEKAGQAGLGSHLVALRVFRVDYRQDILSPSLFPVWFETIKEIL